MAKIVKKKAKNGKKWQQQKKKKEIAKNIYIKKQEKIQNKSKKILKNKLEIYMVRQMEVIS